MNTPTWSYERLLNFAPDTGTLEQARKLFFSKRWISLEGNGEWLWGTYKTAYGDQHNTAVRLESPLFKCSCKSRRHPCKHSLALVLLFLNRPDVWVVKEALPDYLTLQLQPRESVKKTSLHLVQQEKRIALMDQGVIELEKWLLNVIQQGVAQYTSHADWEKISTRMVDAKLGAIARRLRFCQNLFQQEDWVDDVVKELGSLYLFVRSWQVKTQLTNPQKKALLQVAGWNLRKENILQNPAVKDNWLVLGLTIGHEEKLSFRRSWFRGEHSNRLALILDFSYGDRGFEDHWAVGSVLSGELVYYPGEAAFRALFKHYQTSKSPYDFKPAYHNFDALGDAYSHILAKSPWLSAFPCLLDDVRLQYVAAESAFYLWDTKSNGLTVANSPIAWQLLAISGGKAVAVFGEYNGQTFTPLSVIDEGRVIEIISE